MLIIILGILGSGKTLLLTYFASKLKNRTIYANYELKLENYHSLKPIDLITLPTDIEVFLDEGYAWLESRISASQLNRYMSYLLFQSRKRNTNFYITAPLFSTLDKRFKLYADYIIMCERKKDGFKYTSILRKNSRVKKFLFPMSKAKEIFKYYDTYEIVEPMNIANMEYNIIKNDKKELLRISTEIANKIKLDLEIITHDSIKLALLKLGIDKNYEGYVYSILKCNEKIKEKKKK